MTTLTIDITGAQAEGNGPAAGSVRNRPRVVLMAPGVGRTFRGYERFSTELFAAVRGVSDAAMFRGGGAAGPGEIVLGGLSRDGLPARLLGRLKWDRFGWEAVTFGAKAWRALDGREEAVVHYSEPILNNFYSRIEKIWPKNARRLFTHGLNMEPEHTLRCHHIQQVSVEAYERAIEFGIPAERMTLLPYGVRADLFGPAPPGAREEWRRALGLPTDRPIVLCTAALNRRHKRIDYLINECKGLPGEFLLVVCGAAEEPDLLALGRESHGNRFRHMYVAPEEMPRLYACADVFVLPSLVEGFGLVAVEGALSGIPVIVHDSRHFRWLLGEQTGIFVDMAEKNALGERLDGVLRNLEGLRSQASACRADLAARFDWSALVAEYVGMFDRVCGGPTETIDRAMGKTPGKGERRGVKGEGGKERGKGKGEGERGRRHGEADSQSRARVAVLTEIISPYRIPVFNALASDPRIDMEVLFFAETEERRSWQIPWDKIRFRYRLLNGALVARRYQRGPILFNPGVWGALNRGGFRTIVCFGYHHPTIWLALLWSRWRGTRALLWCESTLRDARSSGRFVEGLKRWLVRRFDGYVAAGSRQVKYLEHLGAPRERIWVAPDSVDSAFFENESERHRARKEEIRREMGIEGPVVLYVGRLLDAKGIPDLLEAFRGLIRERKATLVLVGDGPDRNRYESFCRERGLSDIRFEGFREQEELPRYYGIADVLAFPTHSDPWGLVLNEAMSAGLPVVCSTAAGASADLVLPGENGFLHEPGDVDALRRHMSAMLADDELRGRMGARSREIVRGFSPEKMAQGFLEAIREEPNRACPAGTGRSERLVPGPLMGQAPKSRSGQAA